MRISDWSSDVCSSDLYVLKSSGPTAFQTDRDLANYRHGLRLKEIGASGGEARSTAGHREGLYRSRPDVAATTPAQVIGPLMAKPASGQPLTPAEQQTPDYYKQPSLDQMLPGGLPRVSQDRKRVGVGKRVSERVE